MKLLCVLVIQLAAMARTAAAASVQKVQESMDKASAWLLAREHDGNWELSPVPAPDPTGMLPNGGQRTGLTAIATYALLCSGLDTTDAHVSAACDFLARNPTKGTYALGLRCLIWASIPSNNRIRQVAQRDMEQLLGNIRTSGAGRGMFHYLPRTSPNDSEYDHSASQFGTLGLAALSREGFEVPNGVWGAMDSAWRAHQDPSGAWPYVANEAADELDHGRLTLSMTTAGVASLFITKERMGPVTECRGNVEDFNIDKGVRFIANHFDWLTDPEHSRNNKVEQNYTLFGVSRIGTSGGYKRLGTVDWYQRGADQLLQTQQPDGSWTGGEDPIAETSLGLLFLAYGSAPVILNKLEYIASPSKGSAAGHWNQRPHDLLNFSVWMGKQIEQRLNWQIVSLSGPATDLADAPVLYISGDQALNLSPQQMQMLKDYVEQGGIILGNADCGSEAFTTSFKKLGRELFPDYEFRLLPDDHPILTNEQYPASKWKPRIRILGLSNGVRELMLLPSVDMSRAFELQNSTTSASPFRLVDDIILYMTGKGGLHRRGGGFQIADLPTTAPAERTVTLARIQYNGNWDPEPGGWRRLAALLHNQYRVSLDIKPVKLGAGQLQGMQIAHLTGTEGFKLNDAQRTELQRFIEGGGTLCIDAAGGSPAFASSAETELRALFGNSVTQALASPLPPSHPLYTLSDARIDSFAYRSFARTNLTGSLRTPMLCAIEHDGRVAVLYSRQDLSTGLVGVPVDGVIGYDPETATDIMRNIILYCTTPAKSAAN